MKKLKVANIITERELRIILFDMERRMKLAYDIKDKRVRFREMLKIRSEAIALLEASKRAKRTANLNDNNESFFEKTIKAIIRWLSVMDKKYK